MQVRIIVDAENVQIDINEELDTVRMGDGRIYSGTIQNAIDQLDLSYERAKRMLNAGRKDAP